MGIFEDAPPASFAVNDGEADDEICYFGITDIAEGYSARVIRKTRIGKNGERLDNTGANARTWKVTAEFYNGGEDTQAPSTYPDDVNRLIVLLRITDTGWLVLPTVGRVRAQLENYTRIEAHTERDCCRLEMNFVEDSEDDETVANFRAPPASSVASLYVSEWEGVLAMDAGIVGDPFGELELFAHDLAKLARSPERFVASWQNRVQQATNAIARIERSYTQAVTNVVSGVTTPPSVATLLSSPPGARSIRKGRSLSDTLSRSTTSAVPYRSKKYPGIVNIYDVAADVGQNAERLMLLNARLPDLMRIAPPASVLYFAKAA